MEIIVVRDKESEGCIKFAFKGKEGIKALPTLSSGMVVCHLSKDDGEMLMSGARIFYRSAFVTEREEICTKKCGHQCFMN